MADFFELGIGSFKDLFNYLTTQTKSKDVIKNNLMRELRDNIKLLEHRSSEGVNINAIIDNLSFAAVEEAYKANFNFHKLTHKKLLPKELILNKRQEKYTGWDAQKFIYSIEGKIKDVKNLPKLFADMQKAPVNLTLRFDNLFYQMILLTIFIKKSSE